MGTRTPRLIAAVISLATVATAIAQPGPCAACSQGDALIDRFSLEPIRALAGALAAVPLGDPLTPEQYARLVELRKRTPALIRLGALDDGQLETVAASLCHAASGACVDATTRTLRCLAERCTVDLPRPDPRHIDLAELPAGCHPSTSHKHAPLFGLGFDGGTGWQRSRYPSDSGAWSLGIEGRMRFGRHLGAIARVDRVSGRDEATDLDGNRRDDFATGAITRISALAGPTIVLDNTREGETNRFLRLDLLGGYLATRLPGHESGPAAGFDLAYQLWIVRFGVRLVQGFGDAQNATMLLAHLGLSPGSIPPLFDDAGCEVRGPERSSRLALGLEFPLGGFGFSSHLGYLAPGFGVEAVWHLSRRFDAMAHADLLVYSGGIGKPEADRVLHQAVLAGIRIDHKRRRKALTGFFTTVMGGYSQAAGLTPTTVGSGPVVDLSFAWGGQAPEGAAYFRLHGRFGISPDNVDYRAVFLSMGVELRMHPSRWRDRI
jgi:hypothetical protein